LKQRTRRAVDWALGGAILSMVVLVAVFISLQRFFVRGLTAGSVKGVDRPANGVLPERTLR
jgi:ABC-type maltose transport system permease subunit